MTNNRPLILITNDDGYAAEGINRLTSALRDMGEIVVFAPDGGRSGKGCAITCDKHITYKLLRKEEGLTVYACSGTPVDCVKLSINEVIPKPDIVVSGINHGGNQALAVHYSGTMGAAFEGCVLECPSLGVSLSDYTDGADFSNACNCARLTVAEVLRHGLPYGTYLNLNIPNVPEVKGIKIGTQAPGRWVREYIREKDDKGNDLFMLTGDYVIRGEEKAGYDEVILRDGYASLVPCRIDVTDYDFCGELNNWRFGN